MARASNVYVVVFWNDRDGFNPKKAFTVKHELVKWLKGQPAEALKDCTIWRMPDGKEAVATVLTPNDIMKAR